MTHVGEAVDPRADVLDSGSPGRPGRWIVLAVVAVLALLGWTVLRSGPDETADPAAHAPAEDTSTTGVAEPAATQPAGTDRVDQLTFVDDDHGFLVQEVCSLSTGSGPCARRILATADGGSSWEGRALIPPYADGFSGLVAQSEFDLILLDQISAGSVVRSFDGGRSWAQFPTTLAAPAPVPSGVLLVGDLEPACTPPCSALLSWIDPNTLQQHPLPSQPAAGTGDLPSSASMGSDGDLVVAAASSATGLVSVSTDGGATWTEAQLEVPLQQGQHVTEVLAYAAGGGRAYMFIQVFDRSGLTAKYGFRTDDGGRNWNDLRFGEQRLWLPDGVLDGELVSTDLPGRVLLSSAGGTQWAEGGSVDDGPYLSQAVPDGPLLATVLDRQGFESYFVSPDGRDWASVRLPEV